MLKALITPHTYQISICVDTHTHNLPSHASANEQIKQLYIDGPFCCAYPLINPKTFLGDAAFDYKDDVPIDMYE